MSRTRQTSGADLSWCFLRFPTTTNMYNEHKMNLVLPRWFSYIFLEFLYGSLMKLHIEWQYEIRLYQYQQGLQSLLSLLYQIIVLVLVIMWMLHWWCLFNICLFVHICYKLFDERPWYHVLGFLAVVGVVQMATQIGNSVLLSEYRDNFHQLSSMIT